MPRYNLTEARVLADLTQEELADAIKADRKAVNAWERGDVMPQPGHRRAIRRELDNEDLHLFVNYPEQDIAAATHDDGESSEVAVSSSSQGNICPQLQTSEQLSPTCQEEPNRAMLKSSDPNFDSDTQGSSEEYMELTRRKAIESFLLAAGIPFVSGSDGPMLLSMPIVIAPGEFLGQCNAAITGCWQLLKHKGFDTVGDILSKNIPRLTQLATIPGDHQDIAAGLAAQAKILEGVLAMHRMDLVGRELAMIEAMKFGKITGDPHIRITAMLYQAYTYVFMSPPRPSKAIPIFLEALRLVDSQACLLQSDAYSGLANAYAQDNDQDAALEALSQAEALMPKYPEQDQSFLYADHGWPEFYLWKSRAYLNLTGFSTDYFQQAYDVFMLPDNSSGATTRSASMIAILQADAARGLGHMDHFIELLERGMFLAIEIDSQQRINEAHDVMGRIPTKWQKETAIQNLQKELSHAIVVARR